MDVQLIGKFKEEEQQSFHKRKESKIFANSVSGGADLAIIRT
jgi:hypothetical protein